MDILLKDGTTITNVTVDEIQKLISKGIIHTDLPKSHDDALIDAAWKSNNYYGVPFDASVNENNDLYNACKDLCKDNDLIPPEYHDGEPEIDGNSPGFNVIRDMLVEGKVVDCPSADFPDINFTTAHNSIPSKW